MRLKSCALLSTLYFLLSCFSFPLYADTPRPLWGTYGLEIDNTPGNTLQQNPKIIGSSDGNVLVIWEDGRHGFPGIFAQKLDLKGNKLWGKDGVRLGGVNENQNFAQAIDDGEGGLIAVWQGYRGGSADIFAQRLDKNGNALWDEKGIPVSQATAGQMAPEIASDGGGGAIIVWHDYRGGAGEDIYAQRLDKNGNALWEKDGAAVCLAPGTQWFPKICSDGKGGAIIVWSDGRAGAADNNIYGQRVDAAGKPLWEKDGLAVCAAPQNQEHPAIFASEDGTAVVWQETRAGEILLYSQRITLNGKILWEENGRPLAKLTELQENPQVVRSSAGEWLVVWEERNRNAPAIFAQKFNASGIPLWPEGGLPLSAGAKHRENPAAALASSGELVVAWQDRRGGNYDIYAQKFSANGQAGWGEGGLAVCDSPGLVLHQNAELIDAGRGETILAYEDGRNGYINIYAQKIARSGAPLWGNNGLAVAKVKADQSNPQLVSDGAGGAIIVWEDARFPGITTTFAQRIGSSGEKLWKGGSVHLTKTPTPQTRPRIVADQAGGAIVVWEDERNPLGLKDIYGQKISGRGEFLWDKDGRPICLENGEQTELDLIAVGAAGALLAWTDYRRGERNPDIYLQRIDREGKLIWDKEGKLVCGAPDVQKSPRLALVEGRNILATWTDKGGGSYDIYAQLLDESGRILWLTDGIPVSQAARTQQDPSPADSLALVWEDYRFGNWDLFAGKLSVQGKLVWGEEGVPIATQPLTQYAPRVAGWNNGEILLAWEDYRSGRQYEIYIQKLDGAGKPVWPENGLMVMTTDGARAPRLVAQPAENTLVVVWEDYTGGGKALYGQRFTAD